MRVVHWWGLGSLGFEGASIMIGDAYGDAVDVAARVTAGSEFVGLIENEEH